MTKLQDRRAIRSLMLLAAAAYFCSYMTRVNYGTVLVEMIADTGYAKAALSAAVTGAFLTYGAGQLLSGWLGDRMQPRTLLSAGLLVSAGMNLLIPLCPDPAWMTAVWCVNGLAQAFLWPPLVRLMATLLSADDYRIATVRVHWAALAATILLYLTAPLFIRLGGWQLTFRTSALCGLCMSLWCLKSCPRLEAPTVMTGKGGQNGDLSVFKTPIMALLLVCIVFMGALRDGVSTWTPTYIGETYHLGSTISILTGVALPLFGIACQQLASMLFKRIPSPPKAALLLSSITLTGTAVLAFCTGRSPFLSTLGAALLSGSMHGINMILIGLVPGYFQKTGSLSTISGLLNACVYIGSALSAYGFAALSDAYGWPAVIALWGALAALCTGLYAVILPLWNKYFSDPQ